MAAGNHISADVAAKAADAGKLAEAHRQLRADPAMQFELLPADPPPQPPEWLRSFFRWLGDLFEPVGRLLRWIGAQLPDAPYARILLYTLLVVGVLWLGRLLYLHFYPHRRRSISAIDLPPIEDDVVPAAATARALLEEADALAAEGRYGEAVHHLLIRSIEDIGRRRPQLLRPALTSRDIAAMHAIPVVPRSMFTRIAEVVERSLFGGSPVDAEQWSACRAAYHDFAERRSWAR